MGIHKPGIQSYLGFTEGIIRNLNHYVTSHENIILLGDFNMTTENLHLNNPIQIFHLNAFIKTPTC